MLSRRAWAAIPSAALVAYGAHALGFGLGHAPGGDHAVRLGVVVLAALALAGTTALLHAVLVPRGTERNRTEAFGTSVVVLAAVAAAVLLGIELGEGHFSVARELVPLLAIVPVAFITRHLTALAERAVTTVGSRLAALIAVRERAAGAPHGSLAANRFAFPSDLVPVARGRGRAPPLLA